MNPDDVQASEEVGDEEAIPTRKEIQEHVLTHLPPRSWCGHCLRRRGTSLPHRITFAHVVERKGPVDSTTRRLVADLDWLGLRRLVFKSDQEPAILAHKQAV